MELFTAVAIPRLNQTLAKVRGGTKGRCVRFSLERRLVTLIGHSRCAPSLQDSYE